MIRNIDSVISGGDHSDIGKMPRKGESICIQLIIVDKDDVGVLDSPGYLIRCRTLIECKITKFFQALPAEVSRVCCVSVEYDYLHFCPPSSIVWEDWRGVKWVEKIEKEENVSELLDVFHPAWYKSIRFQVSIV